MKMGEEKMRRSQRSCKPTSLLPTSASSSRRRQRVVALATAGLQFHGHFSHFYSCTADRQAGGISDADNEPGAAAQALVSEDKHNLNLPSSSASASGDAPPPQLRAAEEERNLVRQAAGVEDAGFRSSTSTSGAGRDAGALPRRLQEDAAAPSSGTTDQRGGSSHGAAAAGAPSEDAVDSSSNSRHNQAATDQVGANYATDNSLTTAGQKQEHGRSFPSASGLKVPRTESEYRRALSDDVEVGGNMMADNDGTSTQQDMELVSLLGGNPSSEEVEHLREHHTSDVDRDGVLEADYDHDGIPESHVYTKFIHKLLPDTQYLESAKSYVKDYANDVRVFVNKIWPSENPQETYRYYDFPLVCAPELPIPQFMTLGQILQGDRLLSSQLDFKRLPSQFWKVEASQPGSAFVYETKTKVICERELNPWEIAMLRKGIDEWYIAELSVDQFPVSDFIGIKLSPNNAKHYEELEKEGDKEIAESSLRPEETPFHKQNLAEKMWSVYVSELYHKREGLIDNEQDMNLSEEEKEDLKKKSKYYLRNHYDFEVTHSKGEIMQVKMTSPLLSDMTELPDIPLFSFSGSFPEGDAKMNTNMKKSLKVQFTMSVHWFPHTDYGMTRDEALEYQIMHNYAGIVSEEEGREGRAHMKVHWFGILNAIAVMGVVSVVVISVLIRNLQSDLADAFVEGFNTAMGNESKTTTSKKPQYNVIGNANADGGGQAKTLDDLVSDFDDLDNTFEFMSHTGWKLLHADVFRPPKFRTVFASMVGTGTQILIMSLSVVFFGCFGHYHNNAVISSMAFFYVCSAVVAGYVSGSLYQVLNGERWTLNILLTSLMFALPCFVIWSVLNTIAIFYSSTVAVPFATIVLLLFVWICVTIPLTVVGGVLGRQVVIKKYFETSEIASYFPCKTNKLERHIPPHAKTWSRSVLIQYICCGGLPFLSMYAELHYIFDSVWGHASYRVFGILLLTLVLTIMVSALLSVLFVYWTLNAENYKWWWRSFYSGSSLAVFFYLYCISYFKASLMDSFLQGSFFFLYSLVIAYGIFLMMGAITYWSCSRFLHYIYARIKSD
ncbi:unnamed protein product [Amoebophrya sp. A120]|nr:unnamed protein product [Amoebophrya sp. A120]|eukprot:GSA120T00008902001.1